MENCMTTSLQLIADSYERYHFSVYLYIYNTSVNFYRSIISKEKRINILC